MKRNLFIISLLCCLLSMHTISYAQETDDQSKKTIRLFLNTGETLNFNAAEIDSITTTAETQCIWQAGFCQSFALATIDSVWYMAPSLRITTKEVNFGKVAVGNRKTTTITITNTGDYPETYSFLAAGVFAAAHSGDEYIIGAGQSLNIDLSFQPIDVIKYKGNLLVTSSGVDKGLMELPMEGVGVVADSLEEDMLLPPVNQTFELVVPEEDRLEEFSNFKIANYYGEFAIQVPSTARSKRKIKRAGATYNVFSANASVASDGLQLHSLVDPEGNPYLFSISLPGEKPEISFVETAIVLLMSNPYLLTSDESEYRNAVQIIRKLNSFSDISQQVANIYNESRKKNKYPDYSNIDLTPVIHELHNLIADNSTQDFSGVSLKGLQTTPVSAKFQLHNDFKRCILAFPSRVKMAENNLYIAEKEDALILSDLFNLLLEKLNMLADNTVDQVNDAMLDKMRELGITLEDKELIEDIKEWIREIENDVNSQISQDPTLNEVFQLAMPYILKSSKSDYIKLVGDGVEHYLNMYNGLDGYYSGYGGKSAYEVEGDEIEIEYKDFDKIFLDVYGMGLPKDKSWKEYTQTEKQRIIIACLWCAYYDVIMPVVKTVIGVKKFYKATSKKTLKFDFRYGAYDVRKHGPELALVLKLYHEFMEDPENIFDFTKNINNGDVSGLMNQLWKFTWKQLLKIPKELETPEQKRTYTNYIYYIVKNIGEKTITSEDFREKFKSSASTILACANVALKTKDISEGLVDIYGGLRALQRSNLKETIIIDKSVHPYINVIEPNYTPATLTQTIRFKWQTYKASYYHKFLYDLWFATETANQFTEFIVMPNIDGDSCKVDLSKISEIRNAGRILFKLVAHADGNTSTIYAQTDYLTLLSKLSDNIPEFVDLGLPSGTLWASCNLGATQCDEYGDYYAWGEIDTKESFSWKNYKYCKGTPYTLTKYCSKSNYGYNNFRDNLVELEGNDDPLSRKYGYFYSIPTKEDWEELIENCSWTQLENGVMIRGKKVNGNYTSIYLPSAGYRNGMNLYDDHSEGYYWSSTLDQNSPDDACFLYFGKGTPKNYDYYRCYGRSIRPVMHIYNSQKSNAKQAQKSKSATPVEKLFDGMTVKTISRTAATR